jgi:hypothetical protein
MTITIPWWWSLVVAYVLGVLTLPVYFALDDWLFRRRMRKAGLRI